MSDASRDDIKRQTQHVEECHDVLHEAYDAAMDAATDCLACLPEDCRRDAILAACNDADLDFLAELIVHSLTKCGTKQTEVSIYTKNGPVVVSLIPEKVVRGRA